MGNVIPLKNARVVDAVLPELPEESDPKDKERRAKERMVLDRYAPSIIKQGYEKARADMQPLMDAGAKTACGVLKEEHAKERISLDLHYKDAMKHAKGAAFWRGMGVTALAGMLLIGGAIYGTYALTYEVAMASQASAVAITQAATRPSAEAMRDSMQRQEGGGFRP